MECMCLHARAMYAHTIFDWSYSIHGIAKGDLMERPPPGDTRGSMYVNTYEGVNKGYRQNGMHRRECQANACICSIGTAACLTGDSATSTEGALARTWYTRC